MLSLLALLVHTPLASIDLSTKGMSLQEVLALTQKATGDKYECAPNLAREPLILDVAKADPAEFRDRLAWVMDAEWSKTPEGWRLARTATRTRQLREDALLRRAKAIAPELKKDADTLAREPGAYDRARKAIEAFKQMSNGEKPTLPGGLVDLGTPGDLLCRQALIDIGAEALAALPLHRPVVYSDKPNPMEVPLPKATQKAVKEFVESQRWVASLATADWKAANPIQTDWWKKLISEAAALSDHGKVILLCVAGEKSFFTVLLEFNANGQLCASGSRFLPFTPPDPNPGLRGVEKSITLTPMAAEMAGLMGKVEGEPSEDARQLLITPTIHDPLSFASAEALWAARESGQMLVARLPDDAVRFASSVVQRDRMDVTGFLQRIAKDNDAEISGSGKWYSVRPRNSLLWEDVRLPRYALERLLRDATETGVCGLRSYCKFWYEAGDRAPLGSLWEGHRVLLPRMKIRYSNFALPPNLYRFIGGLGDSVWQRLERGDSIDVGVLPKEQKDLFMAWCNGGYGRLEGAGIGLVRRVPGFNPAEIPDQWLFGAEAMPQGVKPGVLFEVQTQASYAIRRVLEDGSAIEYPFSNLVSETANQVYSREGATVASVMPDSYLVGTQTQYLFTGRPRLEVEIRRTCGGVPDYGKNPTPNPYSQLSANFRTYFESEVKKALKGQRD